MTGQRRSEFGKVLKEMRESAALTQEDLAERSGISARGVSDLERGVRVSPRPETVRLLADGLGLSSADHDRLFAARLVAKVDALDLQSKQSLLPVPVTSFVGRESELLSIERKLQDPSVRMLTLTGTGGVGKTRIAVEAARALQSSFEDGVAFVDLSALNSSDQVLPAIAVRVGIAMQPAASVLDSLAMGLTRKDLLLVLDNFEHVTGAAPDISTLLTLCPGTKVLTTSRVLLQVEHEHVLSIEPFAIDDAALHRDADAVSLFVARASAHDNEFVLNDSTLPAIVSLVQTLEGVPLAIELAAARTRLVAPEELNRLLESRLPLLSSGMHDVAHRHRTIRETINWSYQLLSPVDQQVLRTISVFAEGCTLDSAHSVVSDCLGISEAVVLDSLQTLVDSSLLRRVPSRVGNSRFRMLATVREFCLEQIHLLGEESDIRLAVQRVWGVPIARRAMRFMSQPDAATTLAMLDAESRNIRDHLDWLMRSDAAETALEFATAISAYRTERGSAMVSRHELNNLLNSPACQSPNLLRLQGLVELMHVSNCLNEYSFTIDIASEALPLARDLGIETELVRALLSLGLAVNLTTQTEHGWDHLREALSIAESMGDAYLIAMAQQLLAFAEMSRGNHQVSAELNRSSIALCSFIDNEYCLACGKGNLAYALVLEGNLDEAESLIQETILQYESLDSRRSLPVIYLDLAEIAFRRNDLDLARRYASSGLEIARGVGAIRETALLLAGLAHIAIASGEIAQASTFTNEALFLLDRSGNHTEHLQCIDLLADIALLEGDPDRAAILIAASDQALLRNHMRRLELRPNQHFDRIASVASQLPEDRLNRMLEEGRSWTYNDIVNAMRHTYASDWPVNVDISTTRNLGALDLAQVRMYLNRPRRDHTVF